MHNAISHLVCVWCFLHVFLKDHTGVTQDDLKRKNEPEVLKSYKNFHRKTYGKVERGKKNKYQYVRSDEKHHGGKFMNANKNLLNYLIFKVPSIIS